MSGMLVSRPPRPAPSPGIDAAANRCTGPQAEAKPARAWSGGIRASAKLIPARVCVDVAPVFDIVHSATWTCGSADGGGGSRLGVVDARMMSTVPGGP